MNPTTVGSEVVRQTPLGLAAVYLNFISQYGAPIVVTLSIVYGIMQIVLRVMEHRKIMKEKYDGSGDRE